METNLGHAENTQEVVMEFQVEQLRNARHVVVFSSAGLSAESGIPTFRDALTGLWESFDPAVLAIELTGTKG